MKSHLALVSIAAIVCFLLPMSSDAQVRAETVSGLITTDSGVAIVGAAVVITMAPDRQIFRAATDSFGKYRIQIPDGTGDYLVHVSAMDRRPYRKRIVRVDSAQVEFVVNAQLSANVQQLASIRVAAIRDRPQRGSSAGVETGASDRTVDGISAAIPPELQGQLNGTLATIPGVQLTATGVSILGLDPSQTKKTLNGLAFAGVEIPRDVRARTRLYTSSFDPARGGFSAGEASIDIPPGNVFSFRRSHISMGHPALQYSDGVSSRVTPQPLRFGISAGADGEFVQNKLYYNVAAQLKRESEFQPTILNADDIALIYLGVDPDSSRKFISLLNAADVPLKLAGRTLTKSATDASILARIDYKPFETAFFNATKATWGILAYGSFHDAGPTGLTSIRTPTHASVERSAIGMLQGVNAFYWGQSYLTDSRLAFTFASSSRRPDSRLPEGRVLIESSSDEEANAVWVEFGGDQSPAGTSTSWTFESTSTTQLHSSFLGGGHLFKVHAQSRFDGSAHTEAFSGGIFSYQSLADLADNRAATFARAATVAPTSAEVWNGALAAGDSWRKSRTFSVLYGARVDLSRSLSKPEFNSVFANAFGARNDRLPGNVALSPRVGFTWVYLKRPNNGDKFSSSRLATSYQGPKGTLRGGMGAFQNYLSPSLIRRIQVNTGLGSSAALFCTGETVPSPEWGRYADGGFEGSRACTRTPTVSDTARSVELFDRSFRPERSWRANLSWTSGLQKLDLSVEGVYSLTLNLPGILDLNFSRVPKFTLAEENGRPIYVDRSQVFPNTGAVSSIDARRNGSFARVDYHISDLRLVTKQLTFVVVPAVPIDRYFLRGAYTLTASRQSTRGFDHSSFFDPSAREWMPAGNGRHQFQLHAGLANRWFSVTSFTRVRSGSKFTPVVEGDVNGDGHSLNDRAFIFDLSTATDQRLASSLRNLIQSAPTPLRKCLSRQMGKPAAGNSCQGPWSTQMSAEVTLSALLTNKLFRTGDRSRVTLSFANPLGGIDQMLHGTKPHGWGTQREIDAVLYRVRGFDPASSRFAYDLNPNFGTGRRISRSPFRITIDVFADIGRPVGQQQLDKWLRPGRAGRPGLRLSADSLKRRYERNLPDVFGYVLINSDSLLLSPQQVIALRTAQRAFDKQTDSLWTGLAAYIAGLPDDYDSKAALRKQEDTIDSAWELAWRGSKQLDAILSPIQLRMLPWPVSFLYSSKVPPKGFRLFLGG